MAGETGHRSAGRSDKISIGGVVGQSFAVLGRNIMPFLILAVLLALPIASVRYLVLVSGELRIPNISETRGFMLLGQSLIESFLEWLVITAMLAPGTMMTLRQQQAGVLARLGRGLAALIHGVGVAILVTAAIAIGTILLVVPGLVVLVMLFVAVPVAVAERPGIIASLRRSRELTEGNRWRILAVIVLVAFVLVVRVATAFGLQFAPVVVEVWGNALLGLVGTALFAVAATVAYHVLHAAQEGEMPPALTD